MADQEVVKHTKKVIKILSDKEHSIWYKIKEFVLEIFIIVFAVSLSIWLHGKSEHSHQQEEVKTFLLGLKEDIQKDIKEMQRDKASLKKSKETFLYLAQVKVNEKVNIDSVKKYRSWFFNSTQLVPNNGRFEGFKSSGKIGMIENQKLQNNIMDFYQEDIPSIYVGNDFYGKTKQKFIDFYNTNVKRTSDSTSNITQVLATDYVHNLAIGLSNIKQILGNYDRCIKKSKVIIAEIDREYK